MNNYDSMPRRYFITTEVRDSSSRKSRDSQVFGVGRLYSVDRRGLLVVRRGPC